MGGAGFPTAVKASPNESTPIETILVNGCECEPFITCDYRMMLEWTQQILAGIKLLKKSLNAPKVIIAIEDNKPEALKKFNDTLASAKFTENITTAAVKTKYPQGGERQLIKSILKKDVPTSAIPPTIGVMVVNIATCAAVAEAVVLDAPLTHRVVCITGAGIKQRANLYAAIGTPISDLIEQCGGLTDDAVKVILGGPMMGFAVADMSTPITKTCGAITVLTEKQVGKAKHNNKQTPCIRCGKCITACPVNLNPTRIAHAVKHDQLDTAETYYMSACIECGCCSYVCPANIELTGYIKTGKTLAARAKKLIPK